MNPHYTAIGKAKYAFSTQIIIHCMFQFQQQIQLKTFPPFLPDKLTNTMYFYLQYHHLATVGVPSGIIFVGPAFCDPAGLDQPLDLRSVGRFLLQEQAVLLEHVDGHM